MTKISNAIHLIKENPDALKAYIVKMFSPLFSDRQYLSLLFRYRMGYSLDWENPETYNEKLQWLKINDRNPLYTQLVDKLEVKDYVSNLVGDSYVVKTLGVWNTPEEIDHIIENVPKVVEYLRSMSPIWEDLQKGVKEYVIQ